ncbi:MAG: hypothetical protein MK075_04745, partial [Phycisphaerales bacterium]|nr:hypothetical protein [Phycisphaerales bacterium]
MPLHASHLQSALLALDGSRDVRLVLEGCDDCVVAPALLVPAAADGIFKHTDRPPAVLVAAGRVIPRA